MSDQQYWGSLVLLNVENLMEMMTDFRRDKLPPSPICINGANVVSKYKYLGVYLDIKLEWSTHIDAVYKNGLLPLRSLRVCNKRLQIFDQSVVVTTISLLRCAGAKASKYSIAWQQTEGTHHEGQVCRQLKVRLCGESSLSVHINLKKLTCAQFQAKS